MTYSPDTKFVQLAGQMADAAGEIARNYWRVPIATDCKSDASPVTCADREIETAIRALIEKHCPDHGIVGEEHGNLRENAEYQWVIDPIDGTRAFIAGYPTFTTLIALCENGAPVLGVIDQPIMKERWLGVRGQPSLCNGKKIATRDTASLEHALIATTSAPYYFNPQESAAFETLRQKCAQTIIGGDGYGYAQLAGGRLDLFADSCLKPYDFCALVPVIEGAGGAITDWEGKPLTLNSDGRVLAAANKQLHGEALKILRSK